jgi:hypothetical protein
MLLGLHEQSLRLELRFIRRLADKIDVFSRFQFEMLTFGQLQPIKNRQVDLKDETSDRCTSIVAWSSYKALLRTRHASIHRRPKLIVGSQASLVLGAQPRNLSGCLEVIRVSILGMIQLHLNGIHVRSDLAKVTKDLFMTSESFQLLYKSGIVHKSKSSDETICLTADRHRSIFYSRKVRAIDPEHLGKRDATFPQVLSKKSDFIPG